MRFIRRLNIASLLTLVAVIPASTGMLFAQDPLPGSELPATDDATVNGVPVIESGVVEPLVIPENAPAVETQIPLEEVPPPVPQSNNELPPYNAEEMADEDRDDLLRGPVHEAFAEQVNSDPTPNMIVTQQPPEPVEELPPELKPNGRQVEWISGYWAWDEDQDDFIWISGIWREIPQGFRWLPGYWTEVEGGSQWVSGTWVSTQTTEIQYQAEAPPETLELGPVGVAPASDHIWIPGTWMWNDTQYAWRPGYWSIGYESWVWVPARYQWTPRGYYHCHGYWDYPVNRRGVLFAPSHFNHRFRGHRITRFTPRVVVSTNLLTTHFWVRPRYRHYYFGNYYNVAYSNRGLMPWHQFPQQRRTCDPLYAYYSRGHRSNTYQNQLSVQFNLFVNQPDRRPAITFRDQDRWQHDGHRNVRPNELLGNRFQKLVDDSARERSGLQFVRLENQQREQVQLETRQLRDLGNQRRDVERSLAQLQKHRDIELGTPLHDHDTDRIDLRARPDRSPELRDSANDHSKPPKIDEAGGRGNQDVVRNPRGNVGDSDEARPLKGERVGNSQVENVQDGDTREPRDGAGKGRDGLAGPLRLDPEVEPPKGDELKDQQGRKDQQERIENTGRDAARNRGEVSSRIEQKAEAAKEQAAVNAQKAAARRGERDGSQDRLKLPPATRSIEGKASAGVTDSVKPQGGQNAARDQVARPESRVRSIVEGADNDGPKNAANHAPPIRNGAAGRERSRANDLSAGNPPAVQRDSTPGATPATKSGPAMRSAPAERSTPALRSTPAERPSTFPRSIPAERNNASPRSAPGERTAPSARNDAVRTPHVPGGGGAARSTPSFTPPRGDTGGRVRSNAAPAPNPGRTIGGGGVASGRSAAAAPSRSGPSPGAGAPSRSGPGPGAAASGRSGAGAGAAGKRGRGK